jgi:glycyl-tRNA synthetase
LFETNIGILEEGRQKAYLRGELAQGIFLNFRNILDTMRVKIPFGIAQQGKAFRNEITAGQFIHRTLEFDLMELEYFIHPRDWEYTYEYWRKEMWKWAVELGLSANNLRWREHEEFERSHYSKKTMDIEYKYPFGWKEMFGIAYRTDFDLKNHSNHSGKDLSYQDPKTHEKFIPHVIEPTFGLSRLVGIILFDSYFEDNSTKEKRIVLRLKPLLAPYKVAVFPLLANKKELVDKALFVLDKIKAEGILPAVFDDRGNIGKRYYYQDEIGTPFCVTIDFQTLSDNTITVRDRDTTKQERVAIEKLPIYLREKIGF